MEMIKRYLNDLKVHTENSNSPYDTFRKDMDYTNGLLKETPQDRWQKKAGYISKSYKLKKELVDEFKEACGKAGKSQAEVLTELMSEFIGRSNG